MWQAMWKIYTTKTITRCWGKSKMMWMDGEIDLVPGSEDSLSVRCQLSPSWATSLTQFQSKSLGFFGRNGQAGITRDLEQQNRLERGEQNAETHTPSFQHLLQSYSHGRHVMSLERRADGSMGHSQDSRCGPMDMWTFAFWKAFKDHSVK